MNSHGGELVSSRHQSRSFVLALFPAACLLALAGIAYAADVTVAIPEVEGSTGADATVPVTVREAERMGPVQFDVVYDPAVLEVKGVEQQGDAPIGLFDYNVTEPGRLRIALSGEPEKPIEGEATLLLVSFKVLGSEGAKSDLTIENIRAWEQSTEALDMLVTAENGRFTVVGGGVPTFRPIIAGMVVLLALLAVLVLRRK